MSLAQKFMAVFEGSSTAHGQTTIGNVRKNGKTDARSFIESSPWLVTLPGVCILIVVLSFNLLGDGLRDALDPRLKKGK